MPKHVQQPHGKNKKGGKPKQSTKDKAKAKARSIVEKGKGYLPSSTKQSFLEDIATTHHQAATPTQRSYPQSFQNDDLSVKPLFPSPSSVNHSAPSELASELHRSHSIASSTRSSFVGRLMSDEQDAYDDQEDEGYHADYRSDMGDEFYAGGEEEEEEEREKGREGGLPVNRYDGLVYVTDGSSSPSSFTSRSSSSDDGEEQERRRRQQQMMGNSETSYEDASPATSTSQALYSPPPKSTKLQSAELPEYRYAPVSASFSYTSPSYEQHPHPSSSSTSTQHYHYIPHDTYASQLVEAYAQSAAPSPAISPSNSGASTPRGRNPHPRLLWRSILSSEVIDALDQHHQKIAGVPLPRIEPVEDDHFALDVGKEREGTGKLDVEVRERDKERERSRMGHHRRPLSKEGRRWSRAVEKWGL